MSLASDPESPIVFLKLENSSGSTKEDLLLLEKMADRALKEDSLLVVSSKKSFLDKCRLPVGIKLLVSAGHSESDLVKAEEEEFLKNNGFLFFTFFYENFPNAFI
ncbi:hypothetical protein F2Q69_00057952 [Brassica cretica]|uniref:Uncharacterized protein n=1 Tax=Brassica cretica TaxID=69181 RepID=A0A8S9MX25_BRACR|nr:hypothetical protein F2Q69_00057952 [Brassica cretica]